MKKGVFVFALLGCLSLGLKGQVAINTTGNSPHASSALDVDAQDKGFLPPRLTTSERNAIALPAEGLVIYNTTTHCMEVYTGSAWKNMCGYDACTAPPGAPDALAGSGEGDVFFTANWLAEAGATGYLLDVSEASDFSSFVTGYEELLVSGSSQLVSGLDHSTTYYYRVRAANGCGVSGNSSAITVSTSAPVYSIGDTGPAGGIVFYVSNGGLNGLEAALTDVSSGAEWGCLGSPIIGADGTAIGTGDQNTMDIEAECTTAGTAADLCANYSFGGFTDWFLPSKDEIYALYLQKTLVGGFANDYYFCSTEANDNNAWRQNFFDGGQDTGNKNSNYRVRAVRAF